MQLARKLLLLLMAFITQECIQCIGMVKTKIIVRLFRDYIFIG